MVEIDWLDELYTVCSLTSIDILEFLWAQNKATDTHSISKGIHMSIDETYQYLKSLEKFGLVKMNNVKTKNGMRRSWTTTLNKFNILISADKNGFTYKTNIREKSLKTLEIEPEKPTKRKPDFTKEANPFSSSTKIKIKHKGEDFELIGSESFVEKLWNELKKPYVKQDSTIKKKSSKTKKRSSESKKKTRSK